MKKIYMNPPVTAKWLFSLFTGSEEKKTILGDMEEYYKEIAADEGIIKAGLWFWKQLLFSIFCFLKHSIYWSIIMFGSYMKIAFRNIKRHKGYSFINIAGLAIGISIFLLIGLYVQNEYSYDKLNKNISRIYKVGYVNKQQMTMPPAVGKGISEQITEAQKTVRFKFRRDYYAKYLPAGSPGREVSTVIRYFAWADPDVFDVFTIPFIAGNPETALSKPFSIVLTGSLSKRLFGNKNPVGEKIQINNNHFYTVTGVIDPPGNFHLTFDVLTSFCTLGKTIGQTELDSFNSWNLATYVMLPEEHDKNHVAAKISGLFRKPIFELKNIEPEFDLYPLKDCYFSGFGNIKKGNLQGTRIFIGVAFFILVIACINYINLATARASKRAKEIGIKKVVGSSQKKLIFQFLSESVLFCFLAAIGGLILARVLLPEFNSLINGSLTFDFFYNPVFIISFTTGIIGTGIVSGLYPAFYLSSIKPGIILKGEKLTGSARFRQIMIVFQFVISAVLIIGTLTVYKQLDFMRNKDLGFNKEHVINFNLNRDLMKNKSIYKEKLLATSGVMDVSFSQGYPGKVYNWESFEHNGKRTGFAVFSIDPDYFKTYGLKLKEGRLFSKDKNSDKFRTCILNEAAVKEFGLESPVGTVFHREKWGSSSFPSKDIEVIGVVEDFHFESLHDIIHPLVFSWNEGWLWMSNIRISPENATAALASVKNIWNELSPGFPFEYSFLDESFDRQYKNDERFMNIFIYFTLLGIFIAFLGLFGLAAFTVERRFREIGIRKVLGASVSSIVFLLNTEYSRLVIIANIIAWPVAWFAMDRWLQNFAYRAGTGLSEFVFTGIISAFITVMTVSFQSLKAALANPVKSLKDE